MTGIALFKKVVGSLVEFLCEISYNKSHRILRNTAEFCTDLHANFFFNFAKFGPLSNGIRTKKTYEMYDTWRLSQAQTYTVSILSQHNHSDDAHRASY